MLEGFISRWARCISCMYFKPLATCSMMSTATGKENGTTLLGSILLSIHLRRSVDISSITKEHVFVSIVQHISCVMLGCLRLPKIAASFLNSAFPTASKVFFAHSSPNQVDLWTTPYDPFPRYSSNGSALSPCASHRSTGKPSSTACTLACLEHRSNRYARMASSCFWKLELQCAYPLKFTMSSFLSKIALFPRTWSFSNQLRFSIFPTDWICSLELLPDKMVTFRMCAHHFKSWRIPRKASSFPACKTAALNQLNSMLWDSCTSTLTFLTTRSRCWQASVAPDMVCRFWSSCKSQNFIFNSSCAKWRHCHQFILTAPSSLSPYLVWCNTVCMPSTTRWTILWKDSVQFAICLKSVDWSSCLTRSLLYSASTTRINTPTVSFVNRKVLHLTFHLHFRLQLLKSNCGINRRRDDPL